MLDVTINRGKTKVVVQVADKVTKIMRCMQLGAAAMHRQIKQLLQKQDDNLIMRKSATFSWIPKLTLADKRSIFPDKR